MSLMDGVLRFAIWTLAFICIAALTHFAAILILPDVASRDAYHRLEAAYQTAGSTGQGLILLPPARPGDQLVPFRDPNLAQGICFFDLTKTPVRIKANMAGGRPLSLAFRTSRGKIFYSMTDRSALDGKIDIRIISAAQQQVLEAQDDETKPPSPELRLPSPDLKGLITVSALVLRPWERQETEARIKTVTCQAEPANWDK